jgi:hypothetical protein
MDATIYQGSPLADYLEGESRLQIRSLPLIFPGHGEAEQAFQTSTADDTNDSVDVPSYAPREALTSARSRLRRVLTKPLHLRQHRRTQTWDKLQDACSVCKKHSCVYAWADKGHALVYHQDGNNKSRA